MGRLTNCLSNRVVEASLRAVVVLLVAAPGWAADFPYRAAIRPAEKGDSASDLVARSGPGDDFYPTDKLSPGDRVEVYRHDRGGWCAIRPPEGSFSWVLTKYLDFSRSDDGAADDNAAVVNTDRCQAHIGTSLGDERDVRQVQLSEGESVAVLERGNRWCKIAPPAGEFRWVRAKFLDPLEDDADRGSGGDEKRVASPRSARDDQDRRPFDRRLATLDLELSAIVARDTAQWRLDELLARAQDLSEAAENPADRDHVRELTDRISKFLDIQRRHERLSAERESSMPATDLATTSPRRGARSDRTNQRTTADTRYDGVGKLQPVARRGRNTPQYALVDEAGGVLAYVNPAPGVNLAAFQNREVGVNGARNFITSIRKPLITAQRVTLLGDDGPIRR